MKSPIRLINRFLHGDDIILIRQSKEHWDAQFTDGKWDRLVEGMPHTMFLAGLIQETFPNGAVVLDVGCGNGALAKLIADKPGIKYIGTDISAAGIAQARAIVPMAHFIQGDAIDPPKEAETAEALILSDVVYYFDSTKVIPLYEKRMSPDTLVFITITKFWRSPFLWSRLKKDLSIISWYSVSGFGGKWHSWDVAVARFRKTKAGL